MKKMPCNSLHKTIVLSFLTVLLNISVAYSTPLPHELKEDSLGPEQAAIDPETVAGIDSLSLRIATDTIDASFNGFDPNYCQDNAAVLPVSFAPPDPAPAKRVFLRMEGNGITSTGKYTANFTPSVKGKYKINYIVQDSIWVDEPVLVYQPKVYDSKSGDHVTDGCDCYVEVGRHMVYHGMENEKVGYSSDSLLVSIGNFYLPSLVCMSDAPIDLSTLVDPAFTTGLSGTQFSITSATSTYDPGVLSGTIFDPSLVTSTTTFTIQYDYYNPLGCNDAITQDIIVTTVPDMPSHTASSLTHTTPCEFVPVSYGVNSAIGVTSYEWELPAGWTGTSTTNALNAHSSGTAGSILTRAVNICGTSPDATLVVTPNSIPDIPDLVSGDANPCKTATSVYNITPVAKATSYSWNIPGDWSGTSSTNSISTTVGNSSGTISVSAVNVCGSSNPSASFTVAPNIPPAQPGAITGLTSLTQNTTSNPFQVATVPNTTSYNWSYSGNGATITKVGTSGRRVMVDFSGTATSGDLSVTTSNACGTSVASTISLSISPSVVNQPGAFTTSTTEVCRGQNGLVYTVPNDASVTYLWAYSGTGATINGTGNSVTVDFSSSATSGSLSVTAQSGVTSSTPRAIALDVKSIPATPGAITGSQLPYEAITTTYSIDAVAEADFYTWTLPGGWSGSSLTNTLSATPNATAGTISVTADNYCGSSLSSTLSGVTPGVKPATPGNITGPGIVDQGSTGKTYSITPVPGATSYQWSYTGIGGTINGSGTSITMDFSPTAEDLGILSVKAENAYGISSSSSMNISVSFVSAVAKALDEKFTLTTFPNPYTESAVIKVSAPGSSSITLTITDLLGRSKTIVTDHLINGQEEFDMPELESGVYFLTLYAKGELYLNRVVRIR